MEVPKKLKELERKVKELEEQVESTKKGTNKSTAFQVASWTLVLLEIAVAVLALIDRIFS